MAELRWGGAGRSVHVEVKSDTTLDNGDTDMASVVRRGGKYQVKWREQGRQRAVTVPRLKQARDLAKEIEHSLATRGVWVPGRDREVQTLEAVLERYIRWSTRKHAERTSLRYAQALELFVRYLRGESQRRLMPDELTFANLEGFYDWLQNPETGRHLHGRSLETCRKHVQVVEVIWRWAWEHDDDWPDQVPKPRRLGLKRKPPTVRRSPTWADMDAMIDASGGWQRQLYIVLRFTGLRAQQAMGLRWDDLDMDRGTLHVRGELGKSRQEKRGRIVPVSRHLMEEVAGWGVREGYLVPCHRRDGSRLARARDAARAWRRSGVREEVWHGSPHHCFRAGFQSGLKRLGADDEAVEYLVGHSRGIREHYVDRESLPTWEAVLLVPPASHGGVSLPAPRRTSG